jgi:glycosyltransferase involved in cell wall biosynthesis
VNRIRLLKFLSHFRVGGTERQFIHVANGLDRSLFDVKIACFRPVGPLLATLRPELAVRRYSVGRGFYHPRSILSQLRFAKDVRQAKIDIVHTYGWYPDIFGIPAGWLAARPILIASVRDTGAYLTPSKIRALRFTCTLADCVLANSEAGKNWLLTQGVKPQKIEVIRNGVKVPAHMGKRGSGGIRQEFGIPGEAPVCACIGRVVPGKGIDDFLRAARVLADQNRNVRFLMIGSHAFERNHKFDLDRLARELQLDGRFIFTGERHNVDEILPDIDIVVHPSLTEGLSNVVLEAMAAGLPVVATRVGGNPELVQDGRTGVLVPAQDPTALAHAIAFLLDHPQIARQFGEAGRERIVREFSISEMLRRTEDLYLHLISDERIGSGNTIICLRSTKPAPQCLPGVRLHLEQTMQ